MLVSKSKVTGIVDGISDYKNNDYFNIALEDSEVDDNWYIGDGTLRDYGDISKGDKVRLHVDDNQGSITQVDIMEPDRNEDAKNVREGDTTSKGVGDKSPGSTYIPPELQVALKEACETARKPNLDLGDERERAEYVELVKSLTNAHYNILKSTAGDE